MGKVTEELAFRFVFGLIRRFTPEELCEYVKQGRPLFDRVKEEDWQKWGWTIHRRGLDHCVTRDRFLEEFQSRRPDLWAAGQTEPGGLAWFESQVKDLRIHLGIDIPAPIHYVRLPK